MQGYVLLSQLGYTVVYLLAAVALAVSALTTVLGFVSFGSLVWWPTFALLLVIFGLEFHRFYTLNLG